MANCRNSGDNYEQIYILKYNTIKNQIILYNYIDLPEAKSIKSINIKDNHIDIIFDNNIHIDLRLHNASKTITKSLSLKYDTKILNYDKLFTETIYELNNNNNNMSVLRYPGGKSRAIKILEKYIPSDIDTLYSPFFGGGSFELYIQNKYNIKIYANDKFEPLYNFWNELKINNNKVINEVEKIYPITKEKFTEYKKLLFDKKIINCERAAYYFSINRSSFSGSITSGGFSKESGEKRFNT